MDNLYSLDKRIAGLVEWSKLVIKDGAINIEEYDKNNKLIHVTVLTAPPVKDAKEAQDYLDSLNMGVIVNAEKG